MCLHKAGLFYYEGFGLTLILYNILYPYYKQNNPTENRITLHKIRLCPFSQAISIKNMVS